MKFIKLLFNTIMSSALVQHVAVLEPVANILTHQPPPIKVNARATAPSFHRIIMKVDNFNQSDARTWSMRYYYNRQFCTLNGPLFIYLGGEWSIEPSAIQGGQIFDMARDHGGCLFYTEHRFYGYSWPLQDFTTESLSYLSVDQAMADVIQFIQGIKGNPYFNRSKVAVVGGSYSATMATWLRVKFPHIVDAAYASSAPLLALDDYYQYFEIVSKTIRMRAPNCWETISLGVQQMESKMRTSEGIAYLTYIMRSCERIRNDEPYRSSFFNNIANYFARIVQYSIKGSIESECSIMTSKPGTAMQKLAAYIREKTSGCFASYNNILYWYSQTKLSANMYRQWFYQTCTKFGFFQTGNSTKQPFGRNWFSSLSHRFCKDAFGQQFTQDRILNAITRTNKLFGGLQPNVTRVVSIHGTADPWHPIGMLEGVNKDAPAILVPETSHCADLESIKDSDSIEMRFAKQFAKDKIAEWINK